jgi:hypothetical protein
VKGFKKKKIFAERELFKSFIGKGIKKYDVLVGLSGGKDSSATLYNIKSMGFTPLAFTLDTGYLHPYILQRAVEVAKKCGCDYEVISAKNYIGGRASRLFKKMAGLYERDSATEFKENYANGRERYSGFVRPCWVCRKIFIRTYYSEAIKHGCQLVALGINEWTCLKKTTSENAFEVSAFRKLQPLVSKPPVYVVHFPFLMQKKLKDTTATLELIGWNYYRGVQSNAASCLLANAAEFSQAKNLGFHPDSTRLAREVTVGFLTKKQAKKALCAPTKFDFSVKEVLQKAGII